MLKDYSKDEAYAELGRMIIWYKDCGVSEETKDNLINLYSKIIDILDKEKEPKKYYLKHKYLIGVDVGDVNRSVCSNGWFFTNDAILCHTQMKFTEEEIKELENEGWVLENYRKVEVEDE